MASRGGRARTSDLRCVRDKSGLTGKLKMLFLRRIKSGKQIEAQTLEERLFP
jgi:hypothetical protein